MKSIRTYLMLIFSILALVGGSVLVMSCERDSKKRSQREDLARDAYSYGFPLVLMDTARRHTEVLSRSSDKQSKVPMYQFYHTRKVRENRYHDLASLDNDMIYSTAWLNLADDPVVLTIPSSGNHFFVGGLLQAWSDIFGVVGTRATGRGKQRFLLSGPQWKGSTPRGMKPLRSPTNLVWVPIRIYAGSGTDTASVRAFQNGLHLTPLSHWGKNKSGMRMVDVDLTVDPRIAPRDQVFSMSADEFYTKLCALMVDNPSPPIDTAFMDKLRTLGIVPTKNFKFSDLPVDSQRALSESVKGAKNFILAHQGSFSPTGRLVNGWTMPITTSGFGTDYHRRAYEAYLGLGALPPQDALFPIAYEDNMGQQLMGENSYKITFAKDKLPPVNAFWSITMFHLPDVNLIENAPRRYSIGQYTRTRPNPDGSLTIYIQPTSPGKDKEANWLPSGKGNFQLTMKMYWPKKEALEGRWTPPVVERVEQPRMTINY
ncbi:MAG: DUF1254 domain-containing protein [Bdellovibrionales bacterium]|nr:DUF1254 domain-containing protein [Bdellovibrionales bacterium]